LFITGYGLRAIGFADAAVNGVRCGERAASAVRAVQSGAREEPAGKLAAV
jgi:hypothetical protein